MKLIATFTIAILCFACSTQSRISHKVKYFDVLEEGSGDTLFLKSESLYEPGDEFCFINQKGDTVIPIGLYSGSYSDTIIRYGIVVEMSGDKSRLVGINSKAQRLYEVQRIDNGPDYIQDGMFRIMQNGKTGYADSTGRIAIPPKYDCALPFSNGFARVSLNGYLVLDEYTIPVSDNWFYIDKKGNIVKPATR